MIIKLLIDGGDMKPGPAVAQQLGPMGINIGKVISSVNESTKDFKGIKVPVELDVDEKTKSFTIKVFSPPTAELLKKELKIEKGTSNHNVTIVGNASIEDVIKVTKIKYPNMLEKNFKNAVKSVLGTCKSIGILVENKDPKEVVKDVEKGVYDKEINLQISVTNPEKRKKIEEFYNKIKAEQDSKIKQAQKLAEEAEAKKTEEAKASLQAKGPATAVKIPAATSSAKKDDKKSATKKK
ncbi:MAG: 50S ribosomal protein L11 [Candidatus Pacearchaeota archaeon]